MNASAHLLFASPRLPPLAYGAGNSGSRRVRHPPSRGCDVVTNGNPSTGQPDAMPGDKFLLGNQAAVLHFQYHKRMAAHVRENIALRYKHFCLGIAWTKTRHLIPFTHSQFRRQFQA